MIMEFKIFSLNCWLLPPPFSKDNKKRLSKIISIIKKYHPDIIAFQEVWLKKYVKKIENSLPEYFFIKSNSFFYNKGGLVTGLRIGKNSFERGFFPFTEGHSFLEKVASKGYHLVRLSDNLFFTNTHLYAPTNDMEKYIPKLQFNFIQKLMHSKKGLLAGDLNLDGVELNELNRLFDHNISQNLILSSSNPMKEIKSANKKIDYILKTKESNISISTECMKYPIVSDHFINTAVIKISN